MSKDLVGKYCLVYMTPSKTEFRPEIHTISDLHKDYPNTHLFLDNDYSSIYRIQGLLISDDIEKLENLLEVQEEYLEELNTLRNKIHNLKKDHSIEMIKRIKEINKCK